MNLDEEVEVVDPETNSKNEQLNSNKTNKVFHEAGNLNLNSPTEVKTTNNNVETADVLEDINLDEEVEVVESIFDSDTQSKIDRYNELLSIINCNDYKNYEFKKKNDYALELNKN